jgi:fumarate hydratase class II
MGQKTPAARGLSAGARRPPSDPEIRNKTSETASPARSQRPPLYGRETRSALHKFPLSGRRMPASFILALGLIKACAARVNGELGRPPPELAQAVAGAADEVVVAGHYEDQFPVDVF